MRANSNTLSRASSPATLSDRTLKNLRVSCFSAQAERRSYPAVSGYGRQGFSDVLGNDRGGFVSVSRIITTTILRNVPGGIMYPTTVSLVTRIPIKKTFVAAMTLLATAAPAAVLAEWQPTKPVEFVIPAGTGGGADQMARFIQGMVTKHNLMKQPRAAVTSRCSWSATMSIPA